MDFNYEKGGEDCGCYYPPLKPVLDAIRFESGWKDHSYFHYEPGNGTRYEVIFTRFRTEYVEGDRTVMTVICPRNAAMIVSGELGMYSLTYMQEKLKILEGDCYALIPLVNHYLKENK